LLPPPVVGKWGVELALSRSSFDSALRSNPRTSIKSDHRDADTGAWRIRPRQRGMRCIPVVFDRELLRTIVISEG
jgi:hypothetical protein